MQEIAAESRHKYKDRRFPGSDEDWQRCLEESVTVYVGNLAFTTREEQLYEVCKLPSIQRAVQC